MAKNNVLTAAERIAEKYGKNRVKTFKKRELLSVSTGSLQLNQALGIFKGYPEGAFIEAYGWEGTGKTLMLFLAIAEAQRKFPKKKCALIDAENQFKYQSAWAESFGVDIEKLEVIPVATAEEGFDILEMLLYGDVVIKEKIVEEAVKTAEENTYSIIGIDSISMLVPLEDVHKNMEETTRSASQAAIIGKGLKKMVSAMITSKSQTIMFCINQLRKNPRAKKFENPDYRPGGSQLKFVDTIAFEVKKIAGSEVIGADGKVKSHRAKIKITKSKVASKPKGWIEFTLNYDGTGIDNDVELFDVGTMNGLIFSPKMAHYAIAKNPEAPEKDKEVDEEYGMFKSSKDDVRVKFKDYLAKNPKLKDKLYQYIQEGKFYVKSDEKAVDEDAFEEIEKDAFEEE